MKEIRLSQGKVALVDDGDYENVNQFKWSAFWNGWNWYAIRGVGGRKNRKSILLHRFLLGEDGKVDHIDGDGLNCQRENMRMCTISQNGMNRGKDCDNTSGYKGVTWSKNNSKWKAAIGINGKHIYLGYFTDPLEAALAYDKAAKELHGEFAQLNFPNCNEVATIPGVEIV